MSKTVGLYREKGISHIEKLMLNQKNINSH